MSMLWNGGKFNTDLVATVEDCVADAATGDTVDTVHGHQIELDGLGWCQRFVRECVTATSDLPMFGADATAWATWLNIKSKGEADDSFFYWWNPGTWSELYDQLRPGDVMFLDETNSSGRHVGHVGILLSKDPGNERVGQDTSRLGLRVCDAAWTNGQKQRMVGAVRMFPLAS
jgi:hypothetical protein